MDKNSAAKLIRETFQNTFDKKQFIYFIKNLLNNMESEDKHPYSGTYIPAPYRDFISTLKRIGKYKDSEGNKIDILIVHLKKRISLERARTMQRNFIAWYLKGSRGGKLKEAALVAYVSHNQDDWRFSFVKMEYKLARTKTGRPKGIEEFTPAKRYSYLVGKNEPKQTAQQCLVPLLEDDKNNPTLIQLENAFSIEKVTKEFFNKYRGLFLELKDSLVEIVNKDNKIRQDFKDKGVDTIDFSKKLLGQIVFLYFLQKKGWFGVERDADWGTGPKNFLRQLFEKKIANYDNFFNDILEPLFYEALAIERSDNFYSRFNCKIPFLNGGLFDPINNYDWVHTDILIPNEIFSNSEKTKEGDIGTGILDVFDRYNFTVNEDEPLEKEVAVDPEMLGKVFENLLEVKDRKSKGTYYTPREIVHYMCQESLINYLTTELSSVIARSEATKQSQIPTKEDIETLIKFGETAVEHDLQVKKKGKETEFYSYKLPESIRNNAELIDEKLTKVRVCDPAVGSGAFLVGIMSEIIRARNALTTYFSNKKDRTIYGFKRHCIKRCIYGVDIDPSAVEIAKLRLWLSLVVDEEDFEKINPLPNLDYKIVCGNSLLGVEKDLFNLDLFNNLEELKPLFFNETSARKKLEYKKRIDELIKKITNGYKDFDFEVYFSEVFHEKKGFDIVIANPPYLGESGHKEIFREIKKGTLGFYYQGKMDLLYFFFHLSINIGKENSHIALITTNYYLTATGATKLRQDFKKRTHICKLINFNELKIFESALGQHNMITILRKCKNGVRTAENCITNMMGIATPEILQNIMNWQNKETEYYAVSQENLYEGEENYIRQVGVSRENQTPVQIILQKLMDEGELLGTISNINQGIVTGANFLTENKMKKYSVKNAEVGDGIFLLKNEELKQLNLTLKERKIIKPIFKNSDIYRYYTNNNNNLNIINFRYTDRPKIDDYPNIKKHLIRFKNLLSDRPRTGTLESAFSNGYWYVMTTSRRLDFESAKIVVPYRSPRNTFGYNEIPWYAITDVYFITEKDKTIKLKYVLALLNSTLYYLWLYHKGKRKGAVLELFYKPLSEIPIKKISKSEQEPFINLVDNILTITKDKDYFDNQSKQARVKKYEHQIDQMVYKLYGLTEEEIKIVEEFK